jgi:hypothetical protein
MPTTLPRTTREHGADDSRVPKGRVADASQPLPKAAVRSRSRGSAWAKCRRVLVALAPNSAAGFSRGVERRP